MPLSTRMQPSPRVKPSQHAQPSPLPPLDHREALLKRMLPQVS